MCLVCLEWEKGKLTSKEALRNIGEMIDNDNSAQDEQHYYSVIERIVDKELSNVDYSDQEDALIDLFDIKED